MTTTRHAAVPCPVCDHKIDAMTGVDHDAAPKAGDFTVCIYCGNVLRITDGLGLRIATTDEIASATPETRRIIKAAQFAIRSRH